MENKIIEGDSRRELKRIEGETIQCVYLDPPFNSNHTYTLSPDNSLGFDDRDWETPSIILFSI